VEEGKKKIGIERLLNSNTYLSAYPLHDVSIRDLIMQRLFPRSQSEIAFLGDRVIIQFLSIFLGIT
jgi:hypothetical protein